MRQEARERIYTNEDISAIGNEMLEGILACRTPESVEACITYARFLNKIGLNHENYPVFLRVLEVGNQHVVDALIGDADPFLFLSKIQPNSLMIESCFSLLSSRNPGGLYEKPVLAIMGVLQAAYKTAADGYKIYPISISDVNALGKHLNKETGQDDEQNRRILDILDSVARMDGSVAEDHEVENLAIHANQVRNAFFDDRKELDEVIPPVLLVRVDYRNLEVAPRPEIAFEESRLARGEGVPISAESAAAASAPPAAAAPAAAQELPTEEEEQPEPVAQGSTA